MNRREVIAGLAASVLAGFDARGQGRGRPFQIAVLSATSNAGNARNRLAFTNRLGELGYAHERDYTLVERYADGSPGRLPELAEELVQLKPDLIVASTTSATVATRKVTSEIPIVSPVLGDVIGLGLIASHARPGRNVTGVLAMVDGLASKQVALGRELGSGSAKIGLLYNPQNPGGAYMRRDAESTAASLQVELISVAVTTPSDVEGAFQSLAMAKVGFVFVATDPMLFAERRRVAAAALSSKLPTVFIFREHVDEGGLMSYGVDLRESWRRAADYVDKIMRGAKPADLPVELPTKFEFVINLKTANALGLTIPESLLARADEVIE